MATFFKNKVEKSVGTLPITILTVPAASKVTAIGMSVANLLDGNVRVSIQVKDDTSVLGYYIKDVMIAPNNEVVITADQDDACDVILSYVEIV